MTKKNLYRVKFIDQEAGLTIDQYFMANSIAHSEQNIADILEIKVISNIIDLTEGQNND